MTFIKVTDIENDGMPTAININRIVSVARSASTGHTGIFLIGDEAIFVKESVDEVLQAIADV